MTDDESRPDEASGALTAIIIASLESAPGEVTPDWLFHDLRWRLNRGLPGVVSNTDLTILVEDVLQVYEND